MAHSIEVVFIGRGKTISQVKFGLRLSSDYLIVGAGTAGTLLARSIAIRGLGTVQIIEAGGLPTPITLKIPSYYPRAFTGSHAWNHLTVPQQKLANRRIPLPAGKTLGGSSAINAMIYLRPHPNDLYRWEEAVGDDWDRSEVDSVFDNMEEELGIRSLLQADLHAGLAEFQLHCNQDLGFPLVSRFHEPTIGIGPYQRLQERGRRKSCWDLCFKSKELASALAKTEIYVATGTSVQRIVFSKERATGLIVRTTDSANSEITIKANRGIILCGGTIQSPHILLQSGIGDESALTDVGIVARNHLPGVGQNFQDHLVFPVIRTMRTHRSLSATPTRDERLAFINDRTGPKSSNIAELGGFFHLFNDSFHANVPDVQWHVTPTHYLEYPTRADSTQAMSIGVTLLHPQSRGAIRLVPSTDSASSERCRLEMDPGYHTCEQDWNRLAFAVAHARNIFEHPAMLNLVGEEYLPGSKRTSHDQIANAIRRFATTIYHYVGTCAMGTDESSVVDSRFKLRNSEGLWVCDASVIPRQISGNTQATVMMMAERLAGWLT